MDGHGIRSDLSDEILVFGLQLLIVREVRGKDMRKIFIFKLQVLNLLGLGRTFFRDLLDLVLPNC